MSEIARDSSIIVINYSSGFELKKKTKPKQFFLPHSPSLFPSNSSTVFVKSLGIISLFNASNLNDLLEMNIS